MHWLLEDMRSTTYRANGEWTNLVSSTFGEVDFRGSVFDPFNAQASTFIGCDFTGVKMKTGSLGITQGGYQSRYVDCVFDRADLRGARPSNARFERCTFRRTKIDGWVLEFLAEFIDCVFEGRFRNVRFTGTTQMSAVGVGRRVNEFHGNDFTKAELQGVEFTCGIDLGANQMPNDPVYFYLDRLQERIERARPIVGAWPDAEDRRWGELYLSIWSENCNAHQLTLFYRRDFLDRYRPEAGIRLIALLEQPLD